MLNKLKLNPYRAVDYNEKAISKLLDKHGMVHCEEKLDGIRGLLSFNNKAFYTRSGNRIVCLDEILKNYEVSEDLKGLVFDCELTVKDVDFYVGSGLLRSKNINKDNIKYHNGTDGKLFYLRNDLLEVHLIEIFNEESALEDINQDLIGVLVEDYEDFPFNLKDIDGRTCCSLTEINMFYEEIRSKGGEGLIIKDIFSPYKRGKKTGWFKMKPDNDIDGWVYGIVWGTKGTLNDGLVCGFKVRLEDGTEVVAGNMTKSLMEEITHNVNKYGDDFYYGHQVTIKFMERTSKGGLRHPSFSHFRGLEDSPNIKA